MNDFFDVRLFYKKTGRLKYISHLDTNRFMQRTLKRAKLPIWHTKGFNPHPYITFALPLSLGYESLCECMDFRLTVEPDYDEIYEDLKRALPTGFEVIKVAAPEKKAKDIGSASYDIKIFAEDVDKLFDSFEDFLKSPWIEVQKKTKKGMKTIDLKPEILSVNLTKDKEYVTLDLTMPAGERMFSPTLLIDSFKNENPNVLDRVQVTREKIFCKDGLEFK